MPASVILDKFASASALTITLASLAASSVGVGRQSTEIDNTTNRYQDILVTVKVTLGTSPTANRAVYAYLIRSDNGGTPLRTDNAGASDAALTIKNAELIGVLADGSSPATGDVLVDTFVVRRPGPKFSIAIVNDTGVALNSTAGNHGVTYVGLNPESQ